MLRQENDVGFSFASWSLLLPKAAHTAAAEETTRCRMEGRATGRGRGVERGRRQAMTAADDVIDVDFFGVFEETLVRPAEPVAALAAIGRGLSLMCSSLLCLSFSCFAKEEKKPGAGKNKKQKRKMKKMKKMKINDAQDGGFFSSLSTKITKEKNVAFFFLLAPRSDRGEDDVFPLCFFFHCDRCVHLLFFVCFDCIGISNRTSNSACTIIVAVPFDRRRRPLLHPRPRQPQPRTIDFSSLWVHPGRRALALLHENRANIAMEHR